MDYISSPLGQIFFLAQYAVPDYACHQRSLQEGHVFLTAFGTYMFRALVQPVHLRVRLKIIGNLETMHD